MKKIIKNIQDMNKIAEKYFIMLLLKKIKLLGAYYLFWKTLCTIN